MLEDIQKIHYLYKLKEINRKGSVGNRYESTAEHIYSSIILAEFLLPKIKPALDELKVIKMTVIHDLVEIEAGDTFILDEEKLKDQEPREIKAFKILLKKIPDELSENYKKLFNEFMEGKTPESKFVIAIDALDPIFQSLDNKEDWKKYKFTEESLRKKKESQVKEFKVTEELFEQLVLFLKENHYFYNGE